MEETWMIFLLPETGLYVKKLTELAKSSGLRTKETCFGALVEGEDVEARRFLEAVRQRFPGTMYVKRRCFSIEDSAICAFTFRPEPDEALPPWLSRYVGQIRRYTS